MVFKRLNQIICTCSVKTYIKFLQWLGWDCGGSGIAQASWLLQQCHNLKFFFPLLPLFS